MARRRRDLLQDFVIRQGIKACGAVAWMNDDVALALNRKTPPSERRSAYARAVAFLRDAQSALAKAEVECLERARAIDDRPVVSEHRRRELEEEDSRYEK